MAELKNIRIAVSGIYDYAKEELATLRLSLEDAPEWVEDKPMYQVYRPACVIAKAVDMFKLLPLTHKHPPFPVDGVNFRDLAVGYTGENPRVDYVEEAGEVGIRSTMMMYDDEILAAYENGEIQLSPGYNAEFEWKKGKAPNGKEYDIIMKEITGVNHLALLPKGRGGEFAVVLDGAPETESESADMSIFEFIKIRNELAEYLESMDEDETEDAGKPDGSVSHRKDGDYQKRGKKKALVDRLKTDKNFREEMKTKFINSVEEVLNKRKERNENEKKVQEARNDRDSIVSNYIKEHGEPDFVKKGYWNGIVYGSPGRYSVYIGGRKKELTESEAKQFGL